jgi:2,3-bisphosphoglycerate-independent phosphoglycerate mutase
MLMLVRFNLELFNVKLIYIVIDGMGDRPTAELGGKTPLEAAETPYMDSLAKNGRTGLISSIM